MIVSDAGLSLGERTRVKSGEMPPAGGRHEDAGGTYHSIKNRKTGAGV